MRIKPFTLLIPIFTAFSLLLILGTGIAMAQQKVSPELQQAYHHFQQEEFEQVIEILDPAVHSHLASESAFQLLSSAYIMSENPEAALETARAGQEWYPDSIDLMLQEIDALRFIDASQAVRKMDEIVADLEAGFRQQESLSEDELNRFHAGVLLSAGNEALGRGDHETAVDNFKKAAVMSPNDLITEQHLFYAWLQMEAFDLIVDRYDQLSDFLQDDQVLRTLRNQAMVEEGETEALTELIAERYRENSSDVDNAIVYGQLLLKENRLNEANEVFSELLTHFPERREVYEVLLELNRRQHNMEGTATLLEQKIEYFPEDEELYLELARIRGQQERYEEAFEVYNTLIDTFGTDYRFIRKKAALHKEKDGHDAALAIIENPQHADVADSRHKFDAGRLHFINGRYDEAASAFESFTASAPENEKGLLMLGRTYLQKENFENAIVKLSKTRSRDVHWPELLTAQDIIDPVENFADSLYLALKSSSEVINELREKYELQVQFALRGATGEEPDPFFTLEDQVMEWREARSRLYSYAEERLQTNELLAVMNHLSDSMPDEGYFQHLTAVLYREGDQPEKALEHFYMAAELNPGDAEIHASAGELLEQKGRLQEAAVWFERALDTGPEAGTYRALIRIHRQTGTLNQLIDRWMIRYEAGGTDRLFREYLTDALHRAGRSDEARQISADL